MRISAVLTLRNVANNPISENTMSLEQKIDTLTTAIENLTAAMSSGANVNVKTTAELKESVKEINAEAKEKALTKTAAKKKAAEKKVEEQAESGEELPVVSADELKAACLTAARSASDAKAKVKALLKEFGATVVKDVAEGDRPVVLARLEAGEF